MTDAENLHKWICLCIGLQRLTERLIRPCTRDPRRSIHVDQEGTPILILPHRFLLRIRLPRTQKQLLMKQYQAVAVRKHLERNRKDKDSKFRLILIESRIHRLSRYYKTVGVLPPTWRYESNTASTLVA